MSRQVKRQDRLCHNCNQYVMGHELRNHGKGCIYCTIPDSLEGKEIMNTEHKLALDEARRRRRQK